MLTGCVLGGVASEDHAEFRSVGLYDALGREGAIETPPAPGFVVADGLLPRAWGNATVGFVDWRPDGGPVVRAVPGRTEVLAADDEAMRAVLGAFLANASHTADAGAIERALLANRTTMEGYGQSGVPVAPPPGDPATPGFFYHADIDPEVDIARALETVGGFELAVPRDGPGFVGLGHEGWEVGVHLPRRTLEREGVNLSADPRDTAFARVPREGSTSPAASIERLDAVLASLGVAPSGLSPEQIRRLA